MKWVKTGLPTDNALKSTTKLQCSVVSCTSMKTLHLFTVGSGLVALVINK